MLGAAVVAAVLVQGGAAKPPSASIKLYDVCLQSTIQTGCSGGAQSTLPGGTSAGMTLTVTNETGSNTSLGSVELTVPGGVSIDPLSVTTSPGTVGSATSSSLIELLNLNLAAGHSATVSFDTTQLPCSGGPYTWAIAAKQSNDFNGTGNDFSLVSKNTAGLTSDLNQCYLAFGVQPVDTDQGVPITNDGSPVAVDAYNGADQAMTGASGTVSLSPTPSGDFGGTTASLESGEATFTTLTGNTPGTYTLTASLTGFKSASSNSFKIIAAGKLVFINEPTDAKVGTTITDSPFNPSGDPVEVAVEDSSNNIITSVNSGTVTLVPSANASSFPASSLSATFVNGIATFSGLKSSQDSDTDYTLQATSGTYTAATSDPFRVALNGETCDSSGCSSQTTGLGNDTQITTSGSGSIFSFVGVNDSSIPPNVTQKGGGCAYLPQLGAAVVDEIDGRTGDSGGTLTFVYTISKQLAHKETNNGNPFIVICAGTERVGADGKPIPCTDDGQGGWVDDILNPNGTFSGKQGTAVCDPTTGLWWGVLGTFQDPIDPTVNPTESSWKAGTQFTVTVPSPWDVRFGSP